MNKYTVVTSYSGPATTYMTAGARVQIDQVEAETPAHALAVGEQMAAAAAVKYQRRTLQTEVVAVIEGAPEIHRVTSTAGSN